MRKDLCICPFIPRLNLKTKVILLLHHRETHRPTNTGRLAHLILPHSEIRVRGLKGQPMDNQGLVSEERQSIVLFPSENSVELSQNSIAQFHKPLTLIVPDGNWRQASRMPNRIAEIRDLPRFHVPDLGPTQYKLRAENRNGGLATLEAIARALGIIEGLEVKEKMESVLAVKVERTLMARAKIPLSECLSI